MMKKSLLLAILALVGGCATSRPAQGPAPCSLIIESDPSQARVLYSQEEDGPWEEYAKKEGLHITPSVSQLWPGEFFWIKLEKKGYRDSAPYFVRAGGQGDLELSIELEPTDDPPVTVAPEPVSAPQRARIFVSSNPEGAAVLVSAGEFGRYSPWPAGGDVQLTPLEAQVEVGQTFWMKLRRDGFETTAPRLVSVGNTQPLKIHADLKPLVRQPQPEKRQEPQPTAAPALPTDAGIVVDGFAVIKQNPQEARNRAILDALGAAIQEKYGAEITARAVAKNFVLMERRVESIAQGRFAAYDVLEESREGGLYHVKLRVKFREDLLKVLRDQNVSVLVGGRESILVDGRKTPADTVRRAVAEKLVDAGLQAVVNPEDVADANALAQLAQRQDLALFLAADCAERDRFGEFLSYQTGIRYDLLTPSSKYVVASGEISGYNEERKLDAQEAAGASLNDVGCIMAEELLDALVKRYDRSAAHTVYIAGGIEPRLLEGLVAELAAMPGVKDARVCACEAGAAEIRLVLSPQARRNVPNVVQRLKNAELDLVKSYLHATVVKAR